MIRASRVAAAGAAVAVISALAGGQLWRWEYVVAAAAAGIEALLAGYWYEQAQRARRGPPSPG